MIEIGKVTYAYRSGTALREASFKVNNGRIYGIFGLKGSGKSTLLSLLAGARELQEGYVRINGFDLQREAAAAKKCMGYCPAEAEFYPSMTVYELLDFTARIKGVREDRRFIQVHEWMEKYELDTVRDWRIARLSPMQLFRLKLAQALVGGAEILLLDSPTEGLDFPDVGAAREMIAELKALGKTVFFATDSPREALELADELMLLREGTLSAPAPTAEVLEGCSLMLRVSEGGDRESKTAHDLRGRVLELLSSLEGLVSCRPLPEEEGCLRFLLRAEREELSDAVEAMLTERGLNASVSMEALDETEEALRSAAGKRASRRRSAEVAEEASETTVEESANESANEIANEIANETANETANESVGANGEKEETEA